VGSVVDVLTAFLRMWTLSPDIVAAKLFGIPKMPIGGDRKEVAESVGRTYKTKDDRFINSPCWSRIGSGRICASTWGARPHCGSALRQFDHPLREPPRLHRSD